MTSYFFRVLVLVLLPCSGVAQIDELLVQPSINISSQSGSRWGFNTTIAQRNLIYDNTEALHIQGAQFATYEIGFYSQLGIGVMYRELFDDQRPEELRTTQQFVHKRKYNAFKIAHRGRWDQRWRGDRLTHRWRYRLSGSIPLNGLETDASEFYLTGNIETLFIAENEKQPKYDQRFSLGLGRQINKKIKLQLLTQYRIEDFTMSSQRLLFLNFGLYYSLK